MRAILLGSLIVLAGAGSAMAQDAPQGPPPGEWRPDGAPGVGGPPRGPLFISPMGEPFRGTREGPAPQDAWFDGADANHDGTLSEDEMIADAARFFAALDQRKDGEIDPDDIERYETVLAPEIRVRGMEGARPGGRGPGGRGGGRRGGPPGGGGGPGGEGRGGGDGDSPRSGGDRSAGMKQGAARFGYLDYPEPVTVADRNLNRGVDPAEFAKAASARFAMLDANHDGKIEKGELPKLSRGFGNRPPRGGKGERQDIPR